MKQINIVIYGMFPTIFSTCAPCCTVDYLSTCQDYNQQVSEYPSNIRRQHEFLVEMMNMLAKYGNNVKINVVSADSIKGILYSLRYKLGNDLAIIIDKRVFRGKDLDLNKVRKYLDDKFMELI